MKNRRPRRTYAARSTPASRPTKGLEQEFNSLDAQREAVRGLHQEPGSRGLEARPRSLRRWRLLRRFDGAAGAAEAAGRRRERRIDVIVVYKVDRLTRSLTDFAKLVELFDAHGVSFVSVTQSFNTTTSMGRLTLNVLLSFAQFEREVTGERIRDKIAASKKKGIWMGGVVPLGYRVENRALHVVEDHAAIVCEIFRRYSQRDHVVRAQAALDLRTVRAPIRIDGTGKPTGGGLFSRGHLFKILSNPVYIAVSLTRGRLMRGSTGRSLSRKLGTRRRPCCSRTPEAKRTHQIVRSLAAGKLFDDRGCRMSPTWAGKGSKRWRYYISQAALQGDKSKAGSIVRVPAPELEALVTEAVGKLSADHPASQTDIRDRIDRVAIGGTAIQIRLSEVGEGDDSAKTLTLPWTAPSPYRRREIIQGASDATTGARPMRANARAILIEALGNAHRWLDELLFDPRQTLETLASREGKTERSIRMTVSLAFLAPDIAKAAVEGRLPRGYGLKRRVDLPLAWPDQWRTLELETPPRA